MPWRSLTAYAARVEAVALLFEASEPIINNKAAAREMGRIETRQGSGVARFRNLLYNLQPILNEKSERVPYTIGADPKDYVPIGEEVAAAVMRGEVEPMGIYRPSLRYRVGRTADILGNFLSGVFEKTERPRPA